MPFQKGKEKTGGRSGGGKNRKTLLLDTFAASICDGGMEKFNEELYKLDGKDFIYAYLTLFEYVKPKLSRVDAVVEEKPTINNLNKLSLEELNALLELKRKMNA